MTCERDRPSRKSHRFGHLPCHFRLSRPGNGPLGFSPAGPSQPARSPSLPLSGRPAHVPRHVSQRRRPLSSILHPRTGSPPRIMNKNTHLTLSIDSILQLKSLCVHNSFIASPLSRPNRHAPHLVSRVLLPSSQITGPLSIPSHRIFSLHSPKHFRKLTEMQEAILLQSYVRRGKIRAVGVAAET